MTIPSIHHVQMAIPAGREAAARRFYGDLLGFQEIAKPPNLQKRGGVWFKTANPPLHLGVDAAFRPAQKAHVAFQVADIACVRRRLSAAHLEVIDDEPLAGYERFYVADPFGNRLELLEPVSD